MALYSVPYLAPLVLLAAALACARLPGKRPGSVAGVPLLHLTEGAAIAAMLIAVFSGLILGLAGPGTSPLLGLAGFGFSARLDMLSLIMLALVSFVGWIVLRYARTYLDGEEGQGAFTGLICAALAAVMLLVLAGNLVQLVLAWMATGALLIQLLLFYRQRIAARRAARKKALMSICGSLFLLVAVFMLGAAFGTGDMASILAAAREGASIPALAAWAALPLALAAILKSAQFPTHGWLSEVMEAPTPVSALLHAGVINAGGFLLIRFADVMLLSPGVLALLVMVGGFTALFGGMVMLTQSAVKTSLAWSTVAQMGFMILQCGLALFPLALLHIVAHSLYKAHAFLASGSAVASVSAIRRPGPVAVPGPGAVLRAFLLEYGLLGLAAGGIAVIVGSLTGWAVMTQVMKTDFFFQPLLAVLTALGCIAITLAFGFGGAWNALGRKAAPLLRNE